MDIEHIRNLVELMVANDLSRIELREGETHILLRRGGAVLVPPTMVTTSMPMQASPAVAAAPSSHAAPPAEATNETVIRSPMVGTFYGSPDPESPPFVTVGTIVNPDTVVCLIEAMKVFNELKAECAGRITRVMAKNAQPVEFDQPLFAVGPA